MKALYDCPIVGILRGVDRKHLGAIAETSADAGLKFLEVTMNTPDAGHQIRELKICSKESMHIGAGTVTNIEELETAVKAGAEFIVMPVIEESVIRECVENNIPVFPGALTPTEIYRAWELEATMVKVFPASAFGPKYIKEVKAPLNKVEILAVGGVTPENLHTFFEYGASGVAFGASIYKQEWIHSENFGQIKDGISAMINAYKRISG